MVHLLKRLDDFTDICHDEYGMHLLIDGYNLILGIPCSSPPSLEERRNLLIHQLLHYQQEKNLKTTVVFDGNSNASFSPRDQCGPIEIIYTNPPETADQWIINTCDRTSSSSYIVISDDVDLLHQVESKGALTLTSREFNRRLKALPLNTKRDPFLEDKDDSMPLYPKITTKKRGAGSRLTRKTRRKYAQLKKL